MPAKLPPTYVGLDIGSDQLDCSRSEHDEERYAYTSEGIAALIKTIQLLPRARVVCEASGGYEKRIVAELLQAAIEVCVVQPGRVRAFAYAEGLMAKTDRIDARLLRRFGEKIEVRLALPTDPVLATLRELLEHRRQLTTQLAEVSGRLALAGATLRKLLGKQRLFLEKQITEVEGLIKDHLDQNPDLKKKSGRLQEIKGVGPILSATVLAYIPELGQIESSQLSALIGVAPHPDDSGLRHGPRHVRGGRAQVRHVLYMAAVCAARTNPILRAFYQRLRANGKPAKVCLVAVMRKLVHLMNKLILNPDFSLVR
jgi:transposase